MDISSTTQSSRRNQKAEEERSSERKSKRPTQRQKEQLPIYVETRKGESRIEIRKPKSKSKVACYNALSMKCSGMVERGVGIAGW